VQVAGETFWIESAADSDDPLTFTYATLDGARIPGRLVVPGEVARWNAALAISCVRALDVHSEDAVAAALREGLANCILPGRMERLAHDSAVLVDSAHTAESAKALAAVLLELAPHGFELLLSVSADKDLDTLLTVLLPRARRVWLTRAEPTRSLDPERLAERVRSVQPEIAIEVVDDPLRASRAARAALSEGTLLCAAGSVYLAGKVRAALAPEWDADDAPER
jgi:folylpolyglutamate synthase/dihydropteroate synthase